MATIDNLKIACDCFSVYFPRKNRCENLLFFLLFSAAAGSPSFYEKFSTYSFKKMEKYPTRSVKTLCFRLLLLAKLANSPPYDDFSCPVDMEAF